MNGHYAFMNLEQIMNNKLTWYIIIHMPSVLSALLLGYLDKITFTSHWEH